MQRKNSSRSNSRLFEQFAEQVLPVYPKRSFAPGTLLAPVPPVLVTAARERLSDSLYNGANVMTAGWTGIVNTKPPVLSLAVRPERFTYDLINETGEFAINLATVEMAAQVDFCGVRSGRDVDKIAKCGFHVEPSSSLPSVPILLESPLALLCKVRKSEHLGSHTLFLADIVGLEVAEAICSNDGKIDLGKAGLLAYAHGHYYELGPVLGFFGYSVAKAKIRKQRL